MAHWKQGEHVVLIGMTGSGKTGVERKLLEFRQNCVFLRTKPDDFLWSGWRKVSEASKIDHNKHGWWMLDPLYEQQVEHFGHVFDKVWHEGGWTVCVDEFYHLVKTLRMDFDVIKLLTQGRAKHISSVGGIQRPSWVPRFVISEPTHVIAFRMGDKRDLDAVADAVDKRLVDKIRGLPRFHFAYFNKVTEELTTGTVDDLNRIFDNKRYDGRLRA